MKISNFVRRGLLLSVTAFSLVFASVGASASIVYNIFDAFGTNESISGTITTDGTTGAIGNGAITDWDLLLVKGAESFSLTNSPSNSSLYAGNGVFQASLTELAFDHSLSQIWLVRDGPIGNFWCLEGVSGGCYKNPSSSFISVITQGNLSTINSRTGLFVYGRTGANLPQAVPAPATLALLGIGLAGFGFSRRKKT